MQITEVNLTGVRTAVITVARSGTPLRFVFFPMIHVGTRAFYHAVVSRVAQTELVVAEGVSGRSVATEALTLAYRLPARSRRLGLARQAIDFSALGIAVIHPDMTAKQARHAWRAVPFLHRCAVLGVVPVAALGLAVFGSRRVLARGLTVEDLPDQQEVWLRQASPGLVGFLVDKRDAMLIEALASVHEARKADSIDVAVVYGAGHVPAAVRALFVRYGYRPQSAEWLTVFDF